VVISLLFCLDFSCQWPQFCVSKQQKNCCQFFTKIIKAMKRLFFGLLLLAGIGFACEKNDSDLLDQSQIVESKKQELATNLATLTQSSGQLSADDLQKLKAFKKSNPDVNAAPGDLPDLSFTGEAWVGLVETIAVQIKELSTMLPRTELELFLRNGWRNNSEGVIEDPCEDKYNAAVDYAALEFLLCTVGGTSSYYCTMNFCVEVAVAQDEYEECKKN
jgi:hypothetical protein